MEVHHHSHAPGDSHRGKKKWTHYFWEFLMLFLAVFCGFLAENEREHLVEHRRTKEFAGLLLQDLQNDTALLTKKSAEISFNLQQEDSLINFLLSDSSLHDNKMFVRHFYSVSTLSGFTPAFPINFEQIKNSGSLRYFKSSGLVSSLSALDRHLKQTQDIFEKRNDFILQWLTPFSIENLNTLDYNLFTGRVMTENPVVNNMNKKMIGPLINKVNLTKTWDLFATEYIRQAREKILQVMEKLRKEYHL